MAYPGFLVWHFAGVPGGADPLKAPLGRGSPSWSGAASSDSRSGPEQGEFPGKKWFYLQIAPFIVNKGLVTVSKKWYDKF